MGNTGICYLAHLLWGQAAFPAWGAADGGQGDRDEEKEEREEVGV